MSVGRMLQSNECASTNVQRTNVAKQRMCKHECFQRMPAANVCDDFLFKICPIRLELRIGQDLESFRR
jgi:hypothetical protein